MVNQIYKNPTEPECTGCSHIHKGSIMGVETCLTYAFPEAKWSARFCPMATHINLSGPSVDKKVDPIKASKKMMKGK
jgi:hypothetical protein